MNLTIGLSKGCDCGEGVGRDGGCIGADHRGQRVIDWLQGGNVVTELCCAARVSCEGRVLRGCSQSPVRLQWLYKLLGKIQDSEALQCLNPWTIMKLDDACIKSCKAGHYGRGAFDQAHPWRLG